MWIRIHTTLILLIVCTVAIVFIVNAFPFDSGPPGLRIFEDEETPLGAPLMPEEDVKPYIEKVHDERPLYLRPDVGEVSMQADSDILHMVLINPDENYCWFTFDVFLKDTGKLLYRSGLVAPAMCVEDFAISQTLAKGKYDAVLKIRAYEYDSLAEINVTSVDFSIIAD